MRPPLHFTPVIINTANTYGAINMQELLPILLIMFKYLVVTVLATGLPTESVMAIATTFMPTSSISMIGIVVFCTIGSTIGSSVIYLMAKSVGQEAVLRFADRYGRWLGISRKKLKKAGASFDQHARTTVFVGRFLPGLRTAVSIPAGLREMPFTSFLIYTAIGTGSWISIIAILAVTLVL